MKAVFQLIVPGLMEALPAPLEASTPPWGSAGLVESGAGESRGVSHTGYRRTFELTPDVPGLKVTGQGDHTHV